MKKGMQIHGKQESSACLRYMVVCGFLGLNIINVLPPPLSTLKP